MDLKQLEYFVRVAELGSFTRAAQALNIAQPALSRQVRLLEVELRQNLLVRNGRGATPTQAGQLLMEHGRGILHQVERAREELGRVRSGLSGRVALGLPPSVARVLTVPITWIVWGLTRRHDGGGRLLRVLSALLPLVPLAVVVIGFAGTSAFCDGQLNGC